MYSLKELGWNDILEESFHSYKNKEVFPARICSVMKNRFRILMDHSDGFAVISDILYKSVVNRTELPAIGDWVVVEKKKMSDHYAILSIFPRKSKFSRKAKNTFGRNFSKNGSSDEQLLSVNVDIVFLVVSLIYDYNLRSIERYLLLINECGSQSVILLNKADLCPNTNEKLIELKKISGDIPIHVISALENKGIDEIRQYIQTGITITLIGASGVGKSTLINALLAEERLSVNDIRKADGRGKHTTSSRELIMMPFGGVLIDNPGLRDVKVIGSEENLNKTFEDIIELEQNCRYSNCHHQTEPDCAIKEAIEKGELDEDRFFSYQKLKDELSSLKKRRKDRMKKEEKIRSELKKSGLNRIYTNQFE